MTKRIVIASSLLGGVLGTYLLFGTPERVGSELADPRPVLRIAVPSDPIGHTLDPQRENSLAGQRYMNGLFDSLLSIDYEDHWRLVPALAVSWKRIDAKTIVLQLRQGVKFHDGNEMTAEDVAFSLSPQRLLSPKWPGAATMRQYWGGLESVTELGRYTVRVATKKADPVLEYRLAAGGSQIISKRAFMAAPSIDSWSRHPVGTGPYRIQTFHAGDSAQFIAFDSYWGGKPPVREIDWRVVPDSSTRVVGLLTNEYDIVTDLEPSQVHVIQGIVSARGVSGASGAMYMVVFDTRNRALSDQRVRKALSLAVDRNLLAKSLWEGLLGVPDGYQWPDFGQTFVPGRVPLRFDPAKARALITASGYDGTPIPFHIMNNYYVSEVQTAQVLSDMWRRVGINVAINVHADFSQLGGGIRYGSTSMYYPDPVGSVVRVWGRGSYWDNQGVLDGVHEREQLLQLGDILASSMDATTRRRAFSDMLDFLENQALVLPVIAAPMFYGERHDLLWDPKGSPAMDFRPGKIKFSPREHP